MATNNNAEAIAFSNQKARVMADAMAQSYFTAKVIVEEWNADSLSSIILNTSDLIDDGSSVDGRNPATGASVTNIITRAMEIVTDYEANNNAKLNTVLAMAVNTSSRF